MELKITGDRLSAGRWMEIDIALNCQQQGYVHSGALSNEATCQIEHPPAGLDTCNSLYRKHLLHCLLNVESYSSLCCEIKTQQLN